VTHRALTFDTQTVMSNSYDFDGGLLQQLRQFKNGPIQIVVSDVVVREILKHLSDKIDAVRTDLESARRDALRFGILPKGQRSPAAAVDSNQLAKQRLDKFLEEIGAYIVSTKSVSLEAVLQRYFESSPPFSSTRGRKKAEFPDAVALLALEAWAEEHKTTILAVSGDADWKNFAASSPRIAHMEKLSDALESFQLNLSAAHAAVEKFLREIHDRRESDLSEQFRKLLEQEIDIFTVFDAKASSALCVERDSLSVSFRGFDLLIDRQLPDFKIVGLRDDSMSVEVSVKVVVNVVAHFSLFSEPSSAGSSAKPMGNFTANEPMALDVPCLILFGGDLKEGRARIDSVDSLRPRILMDFGNLDLHFDSLGARWTSR
jgi:hypothetical protein